MFPHRRLRLESLECRRLLAVTANYNPGSGLLSISSDAADDEVRVEGLGRPGALELEINGIVTSRFNGVRRVNASLGPGDDDLNMGALQIGGSISVNMGPGADEFDFDVTTSSDGLSIDGPSFVGGSVTVNMGGNAGDYADWDASTDHGITVGGNVTVTQVADADLAGGGSSVLAQANDISIGGNLSIGLSPFGDVGGDGNSILFQDVNIGGTTTIHGSSAADVVTIYNSAFARRVSITLAGGDDRLNFGGLPERNYFADRVTLNGGGGSDTLDENSFNVFLVAPVKTSFETVT